MSKRKHTPSNYHYIQEFKSLNFSDITVAQHFFQISGNFFKSYWCQKILEVNAFNPIICLNLAQVFIENKDYELAISSLELGLIHNPKNSNLCYQLGMIHKNSQNYEEAIKYFLYAIKIAPTVPDYHFNLGQLYHGLEIFDQAVMAFQNTVKYDKQPNSNHYHNLGRAQYTVGDYTNAKQNLMAAFIIAPHNKMIFQDLIEVNKKAEAREKYPFKKDDALSILAEESNKLAPLNKALANNFSLEYLAEPDGYGKDDIPSRGEIGSTDISFGETS